MLRGLLLSASLAIASCSGGDGGLATDDEIAAIALPEQQFQALLKQSVLRTQSGAMHLYALGLEEGCEILNEAVDGAVDRNLPRWRENIVAAYRGNVPAPELAKAAEASPEAAREMLNDRLPAIAAAMQRSSEPLLKGAGAEVLETTAAAAARVDPASVDGRARQQELQEMTKTGRICGAETPAQG